MTLNLTGTIQEIQETKSYPKKDGSGNVDITKIKIDEKYYTCFYNKDGIKDMKVGDKVDVTYTEKENVFEGKTFINYNISSINPNLDGTTAPQPTTQPTPAVKAKGENTVNVGGKIFKVTIEEI